MCMGQIGGRALLLFAEGIFTPSYELTFALGENSCKCFTWARSAANASVENIAVYQATNSQSEQLVALGENDCKCASTVLACYILAVQYSASVCSMVQCSFLFLNERTGLQKTSFFKMNIICLACFECQNDAVSKILRVTDRQKNIMITVTLCACAEG